MRLLADENVHADVIHGLRQANYEVLSVQDVGLSGHKGTARFWNIRKSRI